MFVSTVTRVGRNSELLNLNGFDALHMGYIDDGEQLRLLYSAADVFIAPSRQEAFGKTVAEALSCNTPAVCFKNTGAAEIIEHKVTGYSAEYLSARDLAQGIEWLLASDLKGNEKLHTSIRRQFDTGVAAKEYIQLYSQVLLES